MSARRARRSSGPGGTTSAACTSNLTSIAIAIGTGATAHAAGLFGSAFAVGSNAKAVTGGAFSVANSFGDNSNSNAQGFLSLAVAGGTKAGAVAGAPGSLANVAIMLGNNSTATADGIVGNLAVSLFGGADVQPYGYGNVAVNVLGIGTVFAGGAFTIAVNLFGSNVFVETTGSGVVASSAFNIFGASNNVVAGPGPLAIAGAIFQVGQPVIKVGPGFNINGLRVGGAAAVKDTKKTAYATAAATPTINRTAAPAASGRGAAKRTAAPAAGRGHGR